MPEQPFAVDLRGEVADITFYRNIAQVQREEEIIWEYDAYTLTVVARPKLAELVTENYDAWLNAAIAYEAAEHPQAMTLEEKVEKHDGKVVTIEEALEAIFGGV